MIVITLGDPFSVTIEILAQNFAKIQELSEKSWTNSHPASGLGVVIIGSLSHWRDQTARLGLVEDLRLRKPFKIVQSETELWELRPAQGQVVFWDRDLQGESKGPFIPAEALSLNARGEVAAHTLRSLEGQSFKKWPHSSEKLAVVTGPVDKFALDQVGFKSPGQTEFFETLWGQEAIMTLAGPKLRVGLVTNHHSLRSVADLITPEKVLLKIKLFVHTLQSLFGVTHPVIGVCGLNPHAGDQGKFGDEEITCLSPAIKQAREALTNATIVGPIPADTAFYRGFHGTFDGVLAMYHDQGLGPLKLVHFDEAINVSGGLPHLRVSPDHGPAQDLYLKCRASPRSFLAALDLAWCYVQS